MYQEHLKQLWNWQQNMFTDWCRHTPGYQNTTRFKLHGHIFEYMRFTDSDYLFNLNKSVIVMDRNKIRKKDDYEKVVVPIKHYTKMATYVTKYM